MVQDGAGWCKMVQDGLVESLSSAERLVRVQVLHCVGL